MPSEDKRREERRQRREQREREREPQIHKVDVREVPIPNPARSTSPSQIAGFDVEELKAKAVQGLGGFLGRMLEAAVDSGLEQVQEVLDGASKQVKAKRSKTRRPAPPR